MLWIECENGRVVNMDNVVYIDYDNDDSNDDKEFTLFLMAVNTMRTRMPIAHGTEEECKVMKYRIYTYFENSNYSKRNIIRHGWLTHKLPEPEPDKFRWCVTEHLEGSLDCFVEAATEEEATKLGEEILSATKQEQIARNMKTAEVTTERDDG